MPIKISIKDAITPAPKVGGYAGQVTVEVSGAQHIPTIRVTVTASDEQSREAVKLKAVGKLLEDVEDMRRELMKKKNELAPPTML